MLIDIPDSVFPLDEAGVMLCPKCLKPVPVCSCTVIESPKPQAPTIKAHIRIEKSGRSGKTVTVIENLPRQENFLKDLAKQFKSKTGSGGTFYLNDKGGVIEIQGDHQESIRQLLQRKRV